jgi:hypothetical protein
VIEIRPGLAADGAAIARVRRDSWHAAYRGIIAIPIIDRATALGGAAADPPPYRRTLVAEAGEHPAVIGYASFGPERTVAPVPAVPSPAAGDQPAAPPPPTADPWAPGGAAGVDPCAPGGAASADPLTADGRAGRTGELYAL